MNRRGAEESEKSGWEVGCTVVPDWSSVRLRHCVPLGCPVFCLVVCLFVISCFFDFLCLCWFVVVYVCVDLWFFVHFVVVSLHCIAGSLVVYVVFHD